MEATVGTIMMPSTRPAARTLKVPTSIPKDAAQQHRCHEEQGEVAVDDRGNTGQNLEHGLEDPSRSVGGVLAQVGRGGEADRNGDGESDRRRPQRARDKGHDAEGGVSKGRRPSGTSHEVEGPDLTEEVQRRKQECEEDADGHDHRQAGRAGQGCHRDFFAPSAR
jgi:hypothetical protein